MTSSSEGSPCYTTTIYVGDVTMGMCFVRSRVLSREIPKGYQRVRRSRPRLTVSPLRAQRRRCQRKCYVTTSMNHIVCCQTCNTWQPATKTTPRRFVNNRQPSDVDWISVYKRLDRCRRVESSVALYVDTVLMHSYPGLDRKNVTSEQK